MMERAGPYLILIGRVVLSIIFIQAGWGKISGYAGTAQMMEQKAGIPGELLPLVILTELGGGLLVLFGLFTRWAALALAGFCVLAGWFFHNPGDPGQMIAFMKNLTIAGGFLVLAGSGPGALALDNRRS